MLRNRAGWLRFGALAVLLLVPLVWADRAPHTVPALASHASNFAAVGLVTLFLLGPAFWRSGTRKVAVVCAGVAALGAAVELGLRQAGGIGGPGGSSLLAFRNTADPLDAVAGALGAATVLFAHVLSRPRPPRT